LQYIAAILDSDQTAGLPTSFLQLFSFWKRKKLTVPLCKRDFYSQSTVSEQRKGLSFSFPKGKIKPRRQKKINLPIFLTNEQ
jgi:hypothetical protein